MKQDHVNNAYSAFISINRLIRRGCQGGSTGQCGPGVPGGQVVVRVVGLDDALSEII